MVSTVLAETNGVITEDRFQKMTNAQWQFQYAAIQKHNTRRKKYEIRNSVLLQDILAKDIETLALIINPTVAEKFLEMKAEYRQKNRKALFDDEKTMGTDENSGDNVDDSINNLNIKDEKAVDKYMRKYYDTVPDTITIPANVINHKRYLLPKFNKDSLVRSARKRFINLGSQQEEIKGDTKENSIPEIKIVSKKDKRNRIKINLSGEGESNGNG